MVCPLSSCSTFFSPGKALGHREGISATAAEIAGKGKKKNTPTPIRFLKWEGRGNFQGLGLNFVVPAAWRTHQVLGSKDLPMVQPRESHIVQSLEHQLLGLVLGLCHQEAAMSPLWWCQAAAATGTEVFAPGLFNISGQGTGQIKEGPQGCNYLCQSFLQVVDLAAGG